MDRISLRFSLLRMKIKLEEDEELATADVEGPRRFLEAKVLPWFENRKNHLMALGNAQHFSQARRQ